MQITEAIDDTDSADLGDDSDEIIEKTNNEIDEFSMIYLDFKKEHYKTSRKAIIRIEANNDSNELGTSSKSPYRKKVYGSSRIDTQIPG